MNPETIKAQPKHLTITKGKAWLFGFLAGDGHVNVSYGAGFNTDKELVDEQERVLRENYGINPSVRPKDRPGRKRIWTVRFGKVVVQDLVSHCPRWDTMGWRVPSSVKNNGCPEIRAAYLRGFFDAEGSAYGSPKWKITASSANETGARGVQDLLASLNIESKLYSYDRKGEIPTHVISVHKRSEAIKFAETVGFCASVKQGRLKGIREAPYGRESRWEKILPAIHELKDLGLRQYEIDKKLGLYKLESTHALLWERRKLGLKKRRDSLGPLFEEVSVLRYEGLSARQTARVIKVPRHRVHAAILWGRRKAGIPKKVPGAIYMARLDEIRSAGLEKADAPVAAMEIGCTIKQVWDARKWAAKRAGTYRKRVCLSDHADLILGLRETGAKQSDIAKEIGCSQAAVSNFLKKNWPAPNPTGRGRGTRTCPGR